MRGRKPTPIEGIEQHDFDKLARSSGVTATEKVRFLAFAHIKTGRGFSETARMLRVTPRAIFLWVKRFRTNGLDGLREKFGGGPQTRLPSEQHEEFRDSVLELQKRGTGGRIRGEDVRKLIETKYKVRCSLSTAYNSLKRVGLVWITGRSMHPKGDEEAQATFKKTSEKKLNKSSRPT